MTGRKLYLWCLIYGISRRDFMLSTILIQTQHGSSDACYYILRKNLSRNQLALQDNVLFCLDRNKWNGRHHKNWFQFYQFVVKWSGKKIIVSKLLIQLVTWLTLRRDGWIIDRIYFSFLGCLMKVLQIFGSLDLIDRSTCFSL